MHDTIIVSQSNTFASAARRIVRAVARLEREQVCCGTVTLQQYETLRLLHETGAISTGEIAARLSIDLSTASRNLAVLERDGYIARQRSEHDGRLVEVSLSRAGVRCVETLCCDSDAVFRTALERIPSADRAKVVAAIRTLADALEGEQPCCSEPCTPTSPKDRHQGASR